MATAVIEKQVEQRRICWPMPDCTCLNGGCGYCNYEPWRDVATIERAVRNGRVRPYHRGTGDKEYDTMEAFERGRRHLWGNAESRVKLVTRSVS